MPSFVESTTFLDYNKDLELDYHAPVEGTLTAHVQQYLTKAFQMAQRIPFDNQTPFVFFSDCHRGVREKTDLFQENEELFYRALSYYYKAGYTYVEVGDGDEMYKHSFNLIQNSYSRVFELFSRYNYHQRLILISGNHDYGSALQAPEPKDGIVTFNIIKQVNRIGQIVCVDDGSDDGGAELLYRINPDVKLLRPGCPPRPKIP